MRSCVRCAGPLPVGAQRNRVYCSKACSMAAYRASRPVDPIQQRAYSRKSYWKARAKALGALGDRKCAECGEALPAGSRLSRRFCSRRCINQVSLRERRAERYEATERRRALLFGNESVGVSARDWRRLVQRAGGRCAYCGEVRPLTKDHVIPVSRGGRHAIGNILPACLSCNASKGADFLAAWRLGRTSARRAA